ncbi:MAG: cytochrome C biogenesis protein [Alphaproteobacteria bacterium]|nr:cytochrome C biogenesis protein [Alphaproteobacteria bacterium]
MSRRSHLSARIWPPFVPAAIVAAVTVILPQSASASDESAWDRDVSSAARLVGGGERTQAGKRVLSAGLQIRLNRGWKTYWRYPGDSGVPPAFDFSASVNVAAVEVFYPAPKRFPDGAGGHSIGYDGEVILPLRVVPKDASRAATLRLNLDYAVCEKVCVPAKAKAELKLLVGSRTHGDAIARAEALVPKAGAVGDPGALAIRSVRREAGASKPRMIVDVAAPSGSNVALLAEGPTPQWALPVPEPVAGAGPGMQRFAFDLDGLPPGAAAAGAILRLTAIAGEQAIEVPFRLD